MSKEPISPEDETLRLVSLEELLEIKIKLIKIKIELYDLQSRVSFGNGLAFFILLGVFGIWATLLFVK